MKVHLPMAVTVTPGEPTGPFFSLSALKFTDRARFHGTSVCPSLLTGSLWSFPRLCCCVVPAGTEDLRVTTNDVYDAASETVTVSHLTTRRSLYSFGSRLGQEVTAFDPLRRPLSSRPWRCPIPLTVVTVVGTGATITVTAPTAAPVTTVVTVVNGTSSSSW